MSSLFGSNPKRMNGAIAILRIVIGVVFLVHGWQKVFEMGFAGVIGGFIHMGIPIPGTTAPLVALVELLAGCALILGFLTRLAALGIIIDMVGAIVLVHLKNGFFGPMGYEFPMTLLAAAVVLFIAGAGSPAVDSILSRRASTRISP